MMKGKTKEVEIRRNKEKKGEKGKKKERKSIRGRIMTKSDP